MYTQSGRSMVEMLGVLAIIGVLSVGAIAGYSKAMTKYKLNKQAEQISWLLNVMYRHKATFGKSPNFIELLPTFKKLGEIPQEMVKPKTESIYDIFNARINMLTNNCRNNNSECNQIMLLYDFAPSTSFETCQNIFNCAKEFHSHLYNVGIYRQNIDETVSSYGNTYFGDTYCSGKRKCLKDITQEQIYTQCQYCDTSSKLCRLYFNFNIE